jgi:hypothetical protein
LIELTFLPGDGQQRNTLAGSASSSSFIFKAIVKMQKNGAQINFIIALIVVGTFSTPFVFLRGCKP